MESLYFLIPLSVLILVVAVGIFFWAVNDGQYDDLEGEAERILFEESELDNASMQQDDTDSVSAMND